MAGIGSDVGGGGGEDLGGHEHVCEGVPEDARFPVAGLLVMLGKLSGKIPRSVHACSDRYRVKMLSDT